MKCYAICATVTCTGLNGRLRGVEGKTRVCGAKRITTITVGETEAVGEGRDNVGAGRDQNEQARVSCPRGVPKTPSSSDSGAKPAKLCVEKRAAQHALHILVKLTSCNTPVSRPLNTWNTPLVTSIQLLVQAAHRSTIVTTACLPLPEIITRSPQWKGESNEMAAIMLESLGVGAPGQAGLRS